MGKKIKEKIAAFEKMVPTGEEFLSPFGQEALKKAKAAKAWTPAGREFNSPLMK